MCNDGSVADYYFASASDVTKRNVWVVWLQGGAWCNDEKSCADRWAGAPGPQGSYMSSKGHPDTMRTLGVMGSKDPTLGGANMAEVVFCTSDGHMGDRDGRKDTDAEASPSNGWHFRGQRVVRATLRDLVATQGLAAGDTLVFGGCSAGGWGATAHCDWVKDFVPEGVKISCLIDSPLWLLDVDSTSDGGHDPMSNEEATMDDFFIKL